MDINEQILNRFILVYNALVREGVIVESSRTNNKGDFTEKIFGQKRPHVLDRCLKKSKTKGYINFNIIENLHKYYNVNKQYMYEGKKPMFLPKKQIEYSKELDLVVGLANNIGYLPHIYAAANDPMPEDWLEDQKPFKIPGFKGKLNAFKVRGNSMYPNFNDRDLVYCDSINSAPLPIVENGVYIVLVGNKIMLKRVREIKDKKGKITQFELISDNSLEHPPFLIDVEANPRFLKVRHRTTPVF